MKDERLITFFDEDSESELFSLSSFILHPLSKGKTLRKDTTKKRDMQINLQKNKKKRRNAFFVTK